MKYEEFEEHVKHNFAHEAIYRDSDGHPILVIRLIDAYYMMNKLPREWVGLTDSEGAEIWADAHDIDGKMIWTPAQLFEEIERRLKEKNT